MHQNLHGPTRWTNTEYDVRLHGYVLLEQFPFENIAREWHEKKSPGWSVGHAANVLRRMENDLFPYIGTKPVGAIMPPELLALLRKIESRDAVTVARMTRSLCSSVFRYAVMAGRADRDPAADIRGAIAARPTRNRAAITDPEKVGRLMLAIEVYSGECAVLETMRPYSGEGAYCALRG